MSTLISNTNIDTDTFQSLYTKIDVMAYLITTEVMTANSTTANTIGNAQLLGSFGSNTLIATGTLRGGNIASSADLIVSSNAVFNGTIVANGSLTSLGNTSVSGYMIPTANGLSLGNATNRWSIKAVNANISASLQVGGATTLANVGISGNATIDGSLTVNNAVVMNGNLSVTGEVTFSNTVNLGNVALTNLSTGNLTIISNTVVLATNAVSIVDAVPFADMTFAEYFITVRDQTVARHSIKMIVMHDGNNNIITTKYGELYNANLGSFEVSSNVTHLLVNFSAVGANSSNNYTVKSARTQF